MLASKPSAAAAQKRQKRTEFGIIAIDVPLLFSAVIALIISLSPIEVGEALGLTGREGAGAFLLVEIMMLAVNVIIAIIMLFRGFWPPFTQRNISIWRRFMFLLIYLCLIYAAFDCLRSGGSFVEDAWNWIRALDIPSDAALAGEEVCVDGRRAQWVWHSGVIGDCESHIIPYKSTENLTCSDVDNIIVGDLNGNTSGTSFEEYPISKNESSLTSCLII